MKTRKRNEKTKANEKKNISQIIFKKFVGTVNDRFLRKLNRIFINQQKMKIHGTSMSI